MERRADRRKYHYIYKITRQDGKFYIGMHSTDDLNDNYWGSGRYLKRSILKHGKELHVKEILEYCNSRMELRDREREIVNDQLLNDPLCMNLAPGGNISGYQYSHSEDTKRKVSEFHTGRKRTAETRARMSKAQKGHYQPPSSDLQKQRAKEVHTGRIKSEQERLNISKSLTGRKLTATHRANVSKAQLGKKRGPRKDADAHKRRTVEARSKPCTIDGITIYSSRIELVRALGNGKNGFRSPSFRYIEK